MQSAEGPAGSGWQVPEPQELQGLHDADAQQVLSTQRLLAQSALIAQTAPCGRPEQVCAVVSHFRPLAQSPSAVHWVKQTTPLQVNVPQLVVLALQVPVPLHMPTAVCSKVIGAVIMHDAVPQDTLDPTFWQPPMVHDGSSFWQGSGLVVMLHNGSAPDVTLLQVPTLPARLHDLHAPVQVLLQQTVSTQFPLVQSEFAPQA